MFLPQLFLRKYLQEILDDLPSTVHNISTIYHIQCIVKRLQFFYDDMMRMVLQLLLEAFARTFRNEPLPLSCSLLTVQPSHRSPIAHRCIGGNTGLQYIPVPEGRSPLSGRNAGCRPSGTEAMWLLLNPPINRWAIGVLSLRDNCPYLRGIRAYGHKKPTPERPGGEFLSRGFQAYGNSMSP